jgi:hypothetical protein
VTSERKTGAGPQGPATTKKAAESVPEGAPTREPSVVWRFDDGTNMREGTLNQHIRGVADRAVQYRDLRQKIERSEDGKKGKGVPRPAARKHDPDEIAKAFARLIQEGHTEREARGILLSWERWSQSTIWRATNKTSQ